MFCGFRLDSLLVELYKNEGFFKLFWYNFINNLEYMCEKENDEVNKKDGFFFEKK